MLLLRLTLGRQYARGNVQCKTMHPRKCPFSQMSVDALSDHASGCWLSALGAGMPYNREKKRKSSLHACTPPYQAPPCACVRVYWPEQ